MTVSESDDPPADEVSPSGPTRRSVLIDLLQQPRYEVLPLAGTAEEVAEQVATTIPVTVTSAPRRGLEPTLALSEELAGRGYAAVPHLAARLVRDDAHLAEVLDRLGSARVRDLFVVAGDSDRPVGRFTDSMQLLQAVARLREAGRGEGVRAVGVAGYPEGHPQVTDAELDRALLAKQSDADYVVTQMCFDPAAVHGWIRHVRRLGFRRPVHVGVPGAVDRLRLLRIAARIGVGTSLRFIRRQHDGATLLRRSGYRPDDVLTGLTADAGRGSPEVAGLQVYTLGDVAATERWRRELLERLHEDGRHG
ncbi:MAG: 5,10-methylenetetrahydrofolate reductase [uncultured Nocardioidaceae bacterium]|uniref:Methylenetetrahydrofolate reductase n=1 Tax=uncultured Nocardioidaceae bacterium TaxID=253824 RepID=A0A6J4MNW1_9ACTN|nr:MAG: 5,10-methylenetetrahydrofolate reductase [uncultured Nocardioidaceae bacterium]